MMGSFDSKYPFINADKHIASKVAAFYRKFIETKFILKL